MQIAECGIKSEIRTPKSAFELGSYNQRRLLCLLLITLF
jgi:hypothetical protein